MACIIVRHLLISVHKWQSSSMVATHEYWFQHDANLVYLPIFHGVNLILFSIKQKSKFTEIFNICWKHVPFILCRSSQFDQMFHISVNFDFCIMKKLWDLAHEKFVNILGGHHAGTNIHGWQPYLKIAIYVMKSANGGLLCRLL